VSRVDVRLADRSDDADLRAFVRDADMEGRIGMSFPREPSYFDAIEVEGQFSKVVVGRDTESGALAGVGSGSAKRVYVNGEPRTIGYLSGLRVSPEYRNGLLLVRIYRMAEKLHEEHDVVMSITTILEDNQAAMTLLTSGKCGLPVYEDMGRFITLAITLNQRNPFRVGDGPGARPASRDDAGSIEAFLEREGPRRQFFPVYTEGDLCSNTGLLRGLAVDDFLIAERQGDIVGILALWDQRSFRQSRVTGYGGSLRWTRPLYNTYARAARYPELPPSGSVLNHSFASLVCVTGDDPDVFARLAHAAFDAARALDLSFITFGFHERDPILIGMQGIRSFELRSRLFAAHWEKGRALFGRLDGRVPYLEVGAL
jgi:hypothetical protein